MAIKIITHPMENSPNFHSVELRGEPEELHTLNNNLRHATLSYAAIETGLFTGDYLSDTIVSELLEITKKLNNAEYIAHNKTQANGRPIPRRVVPIGKYAVGDDIGKFKVVRLGKAWRIEAQQKYKHYISAGVEFVQYVYFE